MPIAELSEKAIAEVRGPVAEPTTGRPPRAETAMSEQVPVLAARRTIGTLERRLFQRLQALEDALAYRRARAAAACPVCEAAPGQCDDHGRDLDLIEAYQRTHHQTSARLREIRRAVPVVVARASDLPD
jgi:glutaredoxin